MLFVGATGFGIYTVGLADLGDRFAGADLVAGTAAFSSTFGFGALTGALLCGFAMEAFGPQGFPGILFVVLACYLGIRLGFSLRRQTLKAE